MELRDGGNTVHFVWNVNHSRSAVVKIENRISHSVGAISIEIERGYSRQDSGIWLKMRTFTFYCHFKIRSGRNTPRPTIILHYTPKIEIQNNTPGPPASVRPYDQIDKMRIK